MIRAELLAVVTTTATKVTAAAAVLGLTFTQLVFVALLPALAHGDIGPGAAALGEEVPTLDLSLATAQLDLLHPLGAAMGGGSIGITLVAVTLLGVLAGTSDDRYGGIVGAVLASPRRARIITGQAGAVGLMGAALGVILAVVALITLAGTLAVTGTAFTAGPGDVVATLARGVLAVACLALIGFALGVLVRTQLAGVLSMIAILVAEPLVGGIAQLISGDAPALWTQFLPAALAHQVIQGGSATLSTGLAVTALIALAAALLSAASVALSRRDV